MDLDHLLPQQKYPMVADTLFKRESPQNYNIFYLLPEHLSNLTSLTATMKYLALAVLLSSLLSLSNAACYVKRVEPGLTHCLDEVDKTWHAVGSTWRNSNCLDCTCSGCCDSFFSPTVFPDDCVAVLDLEACEYIVHKKDDPSVICPVRVKKGK
ncbi:beta-microseminoprotein-like isoform X2 [Xiphias gladius]|uniref:beta-microseminoprotein-like isoform X2 n=1 Tax=Xiphias gladius TaxID=8245 RepID=UPI001A97EB75|nr:beta-microseminoprotein-like isoform X2 [Xiphias gladius]